MFVRLRRASSAVQGTDRETKMREDDVRSVFLLSLFVLLGPHWNKRPDVTQEPQLGFVGALPLWSVPSGASLPAAAGLLRLEQGEGGPRGVAPGGPAALCGCHSAAGGLCAPGPATTGAGPALATGLHLSTGAANASTDLFRGCGFGAY